MKCYYCSLEIASGEEKHGLHQKCFADWFGVNNLAKDFENIAAKNGSKGPIQSDINRMNESFFHGAFKKYSAEIEGEHYILKVAQTDFLELPLVEWISNKIAKLIGLNVPEFYLIRLENVQNTFVTKNFITARKSSANLIHIYHFFQKDEPYNCENLLRIIEEKCGRLSDVKEIVYMCLFDALVGNHDRHGRNIGLIQAKPSQYELSPIYDNPSYIGIEVEYLLRSDLNPKGKLYTQNTTEPSLKDYLEEFSRLGHKEICEDFVAKVRSKWEAIMKLIEEPELSDKRKEAFKKLLLKREKELKIE